MKAIVGEGARPRGRLARLWLARCIAMGLWTGAAAQAAVYYVSPGGDDAASGLSVSNAWRTLAMANSVIASGDTLVLRAGAYSDPIMPGKALMLDHVTYIAYPGEHPVLTGYWGSVAALHLAGDTYITVDGLTFSNNYRNVSAQRADHLHLYNCRMGWCDPARDFNGSSVQVYDSAFVHVSNCVFDAWGIVTPLQDDKGTLFELGSKDNAETGHSALIEESIFTYGSHDCMRIATPRNIIRHNIWRNDNWMWNPVTGGRNGNRCLELNGTYAYSNLIERNDFGWTGIPPDQTNLVIGLEITSEGNIIRGNTFHHMRGAGLGFYDKGWPVTPVLNRVYQNTFVDCGYDTLAMRRECQSAIWFAQVTCVSNSIMNNLFYTLGPAGVFAFTGSNGLYNQRTAGNFENAGDPLFAGDVRAASAAPVRLDVDLQAQSPCVDAGAWLTTVRSPSGGGTEVEVQDAGFFAAGWDHPGAVADRIQLEGQATTVGISEVDYLNNRLVLMSPATWTTGQGVALAYRGARPDQGAREAGGGGSGSNAPPRPAPPTALREVP